MTFGAEEVRALWDVVEDDVTRIAPFMRLWGLDPQLVDDVAGFAYSLAQIELVSDSPWDDRYDAPIYRLRDTARRITRALDDEMERSL